MNMKFGTSFQNYICFHKFLYAKIPYRIRTRRCLFFVSIISLKQSKHHYQSKESSNKKSD